MTKSPTTMRKRWKECNSRFLSQCKENRGYCTFIEENICCKDCDNDDCEERCSVLEMTK